MAANGPFSGAVLHTVQLSVHQTKTDTLGFLLSLAEFSSEVWSGPKKRLRSWMEQGDRTLPYGPSQKHAKTIAISPEDFGNAKPLAFNQKAKAVRTERFWHGVFLITLINK